MMIRRAALVLATALAARRVRRGRAARGRDRAGKVRGGQRGGALAAGRRHARGARGGAAQARRDRTCSSRRGSTATRAIPRRWPRRGRRSPSSSTAPPIRPLAPSPSRRRRPARPCPPRARRGWATRYASSRCPRRRLRPPWARRGGGIPGPRATRSSSRAAGHVPRPCRRLRWTCGCGDGTRDLRGAPHTRGCEGRPERAFCLLALPRRTHEPAPDP